MLPPVRELGLQRLSLQPLSLPAREVGELDRQLREGGWMARRERLVERRQLAEQAAGLPAVADDVVEHHREHVHPGAEPQEENAQQLPAGQIERLPGILADTA